MKHAVLVLCGIWVFAGVHAYGDPATEQEVRQTIINSNAYSRQNLKDAPDTVSKDGSLEFWSSGGLLQEIEPSGQPDEYESFTIKPKHINVITLVPGQIAVALYYSEGSMNPKGSNPVDDYRTRVTEVYVKEGAKWKVRAAHWSPITGGSGTSQTAVID